MFLFFRHKKPRLRDSVHSLSREHTPGERISPQASRSLASRAAEFASFSMSELTHASHCARNSVSLRASSALRGEASSRMRPSRAAGRALKVRTSGPASPREGQNGTSFQVLLKPSRQGRRTATEKRYTDQVRTINELNILITSA